MLEQAMYQWDAVDEVAAFVRDHPWATMVSTGAGQAPVVSYVPLLLDGYEDGALCVSGHLARADAALHGLGSSESVLIMQGPHGYISPTFYAGGTYVPTWNFVAVHLHGRIEILGPSETWTILERTVKRFEDEREEPWSMRTVEGYARRIAPGATGFRLRADRVAAKAKLSQDKPAETVDAVIAALETDEVHGNAELAAAMRHHNGSRDAR